MKVHNQFHEKHFKKENLNISLNPAPIKSLYFYFLFLLSLEFFSLIWYALILINHHFKGKIVLLNINSHFTH